MNVTAIVAAYRLTGLKLELNHLRWGGLGVITRLYNDWENLKVAIDHVVAEYDQRSDHHPDERMCALLIVGEDHRFRYHPGVDPLGLCRAVWRTYALGRREGGSTIAMQLVRTITGRYEKTLARKIDEIQLACKLTNYISREKIPSLYLWVAYYGWRMNNFAQACERLGIKPNSTKLSDAAELVARLKYPQPRTLDKFRARQIENRCRYLVHRYQRDRPGNNSELVLQYGTIQSRNITS